ncbi:hypothetical protein, partial [Sphingobacterium multivorum]|uniref:hypothetical protein n=1 Tax=Sphingobacterium multivorum TaxID=28454 RepID=UPI00289A5B26
MKDSHRDSRPGARVSGGDLVVHDFCRSYNRVFYSCACEGLHGVIGKSEWFFANFDALIQFVKGRPF